MTWVNIPNADIDQDSPGTQPLFTALRDNPGAIAAGDSGAPGIRAEALINTHLGAFSGTGTTASAVTGLTGIRRVAGYAGFYNAVTSPRALQISLSDDNGVNWGAYQTMYSAPAKHIANGWWTLDMVSGAFTYAGTSLHESNGSTALGFLTSSTLTIPGTRANAFRIRCADTGMTYAFSSYKMTGDKT